MKKILFYLSIILFCALIYISFFNVFQADDYFYARLTREFGIFQNMVHLYFYWGRRYFSYSLNALIPAGNLNFYWLPKFLPLLYLALLIFGFYLNFRHYFGLNKKKAFQKSFLLFLFYTVCLSRISEHYFWICCTNIYILPTIIALFLIYFFGKKTQNPRFKIIVFLLIFLLMGSNENMAIYLLAFLWFNYFKKKTAEHISYSLFGTVFFLIAFLAPGNFVRHLQIEPINGSFLILLLKKVLAFIAISGYILLKIILLMPLFIYIFKNEIDSVIKRVSIKNIKIISGFTVLVIAFMAYLIALIARLTELPMFFVLLSGAVLCRYYFKTIQKWYWISLIIIFLPTINLFSYKKSSIDFDFNLNTIAQELLFTPLSEYEKEMNERHLFIKFSRSKEVEVEPIKIIPKIFYFQEIGTRENPNGFNEHLKRFYEKDGVYLSEKPK
jgi:hypothetical protein